MFDKYNDIMTVPEVCEALKVGKNTVYQLIKENALMSFNIGKIHKIKKTDLESYVRKTSKLSYF